MARRKSKSIPPPTASAPAYPAGAEPLMRFRQIRPSLEPQDPGLLDGFQEWAAREFERRRATKSEWLAAWKTHLEREV